MRLSFPSKTFLLGEYAVLQGGRALLLGHPPLFRCAIEEGAGASPFHAESPAGRWLAAHPAASRLAFEDPHKGKGGFGGSGAEFLCAWAASSGVEAPRPEDPHAIFAWNAWEDSRGLGGAGSGADILTQAFGVSREAPFFLHVDLAGRSLTELFPARAGGELSLFHTGKKLATHEQKAPASLPMAELEALTEGAREQLESGLFRAFAGTLTAYGEKLASLGLLAPHSAQALSGLKGMPGVLGAKGCGAMGADVLVVAHQGADLGPWAAQNSLESILTLPV